ncbi:MAG: peptidoglycan editing factor PgeF [Cyanobacteria bacterium J06600_6]
MNQLWHWQTRPGYSYLTCDLLAHWQHGFFSQLSYPQTPEDLTSILQSQTKAFRVKQVHGNLVLSPEAITAKLNESDNMNKLAEADGVISNSPNQSVWAASADCTPVIVGDLTTGRVCAIHAGWRGTAQKIVSQAIIKFIEFGSQKADLRIAIGPAISGKMYQVDEHVAIEVGRSIVADSAIEPERLLNKLSELPNSPILPDNAPGKVRLDVPRVNHIQLEQLGIDPQQIAIAPYCTFKDSNYFFSYRRTGEKKVQWSGIVSK